jgi:lipopolysaccharide/colanic/teichoic acid biosynthesis glycosyltransferase
MSGTFRLVRNELGFTLAIFVATLGFIYYCQLHHEATVGLTYQAAWSVAATAVSFVFLDAIKYLDSFRPRPSRTDLFTLYLSLVPPFLLLKQTFFAFTGVTIVHYREILLGLPLVALCGWIYLFAAGLLFERSGKKRKIWLLLDGAETVELRRELAAHGLDRYYDLNGNPDDADLAIISRVGSGKFETSPDLLLAHLNGVPVRDNRYLLAEIRGREDLNSLNLWFFLLTATPQRRVFRVYFFAKSLIEPVCAAVLLALLLPLSLLVAIGVRVSGPGPILYRQKRLGYRGKQFELIKFRSMVQNAEESGPALAGAQTAKVTRIGSFLRKSHFDEIPQLWNVIKGEMSFVGPRPERPEFYSIFSTEIPLFWIRTLLRPGITGWAQVSSGYASTVAESWEKLEYDLYYMKRMSPVLDLKILVRTFLIFIAAKDELAL